MGRRYGGYPTPVACRCWGGLRRREVRAWSICIFNVSMIPLFSFAGCCVWSWSTCVRNCSFSLRDCLQYLFSGYTLHSIRHTLAMARKLGDLLRDAAVEADRFGHLCEYIAPFDQEMCLYDVLLVGNTFPQPRKKNNSYFLSIILFALLLISTSNRGILHTVERSCLCIRQ